MTDEPARSATLFAARYAREHGLTVSYDPNLRRNLWSDEQTARQYIREGLNLCDVAKLSDEECTFLCGDGEIDALGHRLLAEHPNLKLLFVTCGAGGSYAFCGSRMAFVPGFSVKIADTTGAGDAFVGAVSVSYTHLIILNVLFAGKINKKKTKYVIISTYKAALEGNI